MEQTAHHSPNGAGHEQSEVSVRLIVVSLAFLAVGTFLVFVLVVGIFRYFYDTDKTAEALRQGVIPPEPRIEVAPYEQLQQLRAHEDHVLNSYAWVDKSTGTVRVPIDRAIDMLPAKGLTRALARCVCRYSCQPRRNCSIRGLRAPAIAVVVRKAPLRCGAPGESRPAAKPRRFYRCRRSSGRCPLPVQKPGRFQPPETLAIPRSAVR